MSLNPDDVLPVRMMWAAARPAKGGKYWVDYTSIRYRARDAKAAVGDYLKGGWAELRKRGWTVVRVDVVASR